MTIAETVNDWFRERLAKGAIARDTRAYNQVHAALGELVARLEAADSDQPETAAPAPGRRGDRSGGDTGGAPDAAAAT